MNDEPENDEPVSVPPPVPPRPPSPIPGGPPGGEPPLLPGQDPSLWEGGSAELLPSSDGYAGIPRSKVGPGAILVGLLIAIVLIGIGQVIVAGFDSSLTSDDPSTGASLAAQLAVVAAFIATAIGVVASGNREGIVDALRRLGLRPASLGAAVVTVLISIGLYFLSATVVNLIFSPEQQDIAENLGADSNSAAFVTVLAGLLIVPGAAIAEELMFRGFIFGGLRQRMPLWPAAVISGVLFGSLHLTAGDLGVAIQLSLFGVILAWAYERSGSLWTSIALHGTNNAIAFALLVTNTI